MATRGSGPLRAAIFLTLAMLAGGASIVILSQLIGNYQKEIDEARRPEDTVMVIVAARDLYQGVTITEEDLYAVEIPPKYLPDGVFLSPEHVVGRIPRERILANEFVRADRLADPESGVGLNAIIPRGMRAISVSARDGEALSGFLNPLNYVDVLVTVGDLKDDIEVETRTLLQAIFVLGVNSRMQRESREEAREKRGKQSPSVTLLVTAEEAEQLAHAEKLGRLRLTLRNDLDVNFSNLTGVDISALRGRIEDASPKETVRPRARRSTPKAAPTQGLKIIRGDSIEVKEIDKNGELVSPSGRRR
jgi:pilus assembly protein CpaB